MSKCILDFNGTMFEEKDETLFFKGLFYKLLGYKLRKARFDEAKNLLKIKSDTERKINEYKQSLASETDMVLQEKLRNQAEQLKIIYGEFNDKVVSDPLVTCPFVFDYTLKFAKKNHKKLYKDVLESLHDLSSRGVTIGILSSSYHREIMELLEESGYLWDYGMIFGNVLLTDGNHDSYEPGDPEKLFDFLRDPSESGDAKEFLLTINCDNKAEILKTVFFDNLDFNPKETAYVGDSIPDIPCFESVEYPVVALSVAKKLYLGNYEGIEPEFIEYCRTEPKLRIPSNKDEFLKALRMD